MEREEKKKQEEEELVVKLKQGVLVGKRGNSCTTPSPTWKIGLAQSDGSLLQDLPFSSNSASLSVRKLGANLWEFQPQVKKVVKMSKLGPLPQNHKDKSKLPSQAADPPDSPPQQVKYKKLIFFKSKLHIVYIIIKTVLLVQLNVFLFCSNCVYFEFTDSRFWIRLDVETMPDRLERQTEHIYW